MSLDRRGRFVVDGAFIAGAGYAGMMLVMAGILVVRAAPNDHGGIVYQGISPHFEEIGPDELAPYYEATVATLCADDGGDSAVSVEWSRVP